MDGEEMEGEGVSEVSEIASTEQKPTEPKPRIVVVIEGGLITNVLSDVAIQAYSVDYDGKSAPSVETTLIPQNHGSFAVRAFADSQEVKVDPERVAEIVKAIEDGWEQEGVEK